MRNVTDKEREKLSAEIAGLESLDLSQLRARWKLLYETEAPPTDAYLELDGNDPFQRLRLADLTRVALAARALQR